ncbi:MAG: LLM class flavin-dependent oxidoreductase [Candidatus Hodarchaeota archaeon]
MTRAGIDIQLFQQLYTSKKEAKMISTLDHLSEGRIEIGMGAGWKAIEYKAYGLEFPSAKVRIDQLDEGLQVLRALWSEEPKPSFSGKYYSLENALCFPKPFQKPYPRLWIGAPSGGKHMLKITAKHGDGINLAWTVPPDKCEWVFNRLDQQCKDMERDSSEILRSVGYWVRMFADEEEMEKYMKEEAKKQNLPFKEFKKQVQNLLMGTKDQIIEKLLEYQKIGVPHFIFMFPYPEELKYLQLFNNEILPAIKA